MRVERRRPDEPKPASFIPDGTDFVGVSGVFIPFKFRVKLLAAHRVALEGDYAGIR